MWAVRRLGTGDHAGARALNRLFAEVFEEPETYDHAKPSAAYVEDVLRLDHVVLLVAEDRDQVVGGLGGYLLHKFEQERSELFIYDLAVAANRRREGIATALIEETRRIAREGGAWSIFVEADVFPEDAPARALYRKFAREEIRAHHFDIAP